MRFSLSVSMQLSIFCMKNFKFHISFHFMKLLIHYLKYRIVYCTRCAVKKVLLVLGTYNFHSMLTYILFWSKKISFIFRRDTPIKVSCTHIKSFGGGSMYHSIIYFASARMEALRLWYYSIAPCTCKDLFSLEVYFILRCICKPIFLLSGPILWLFCFTASWV